MSEPDWKARALKAEDEAKVLRHALEMIKVNMPTPEDVWSGGACFDVKGYATDILTALEPRA